MAEDEKSDKKSKSSSHHSKGGISFGLEVILFIVVIFIIWVLAGGNKKETQEGLFINPANITPTTPTEGYNN
jgi:hypothetical protein